MANGVKFIRVHGRIVPVRQKKGEGKPPVKKQDAATRISEYHKSASVKSSFGIGAGLGVANAGGRELLIHQARAQAFKRAGNAAGIAKSAAGSKLGLALGALGYGAAVGAAGVAIYHDRKANQAKKNSANGFGHAIKGLGAAALGFVGVNMATAGAVVGGTLAQPFTKRFAEYRKFKRSKKVLSEVVTPARKLLGYGR